jgi:hypothetical protein
VIGLSALAALLLAAALVGQATRRFFREPV